MSVINSMLKDLDKRQQPHSLENLNVAPVQYRGKPASSLPWILLAIVSVLLIAGITYSWITLLNIEPTASNPPASKQLQASNPASTEIEPSAGKEPSASKEPSAGIEPSARKQPPANAKPLANNGEQMTVAELVVEPVPVIATASTTAGSTQTKDQVAELSEAASSPSAVVEASDLNPVTVQANPSQPLASKVEPALEAKLEAKLEQSETITKAVTEPRASSMAVTEVQVSNEQLAQRRYRLATEAENQGLLSDAVVYYSEVLALKPEMHAARRQLAALYYGQNRLDLASDTLSKGMALFPQEHDYAILLSRVQLASGKRKQALVTLGLISDQSSYAKQKWTMQSSLAQKEGDYLLAEQSYRNLLRIETHQAKWWMGLAHALDAQQKYEPAKQAYHQALSASGLSKQAAEYIENRLVQLGESE